MPRKSRIVKLNPEQQALAATYRPLAINVTRRCYRGRPVPEDAYSEGFIGLCIAAGRFDKNTALFSTYAPYWVRAYVIRYMLNGCHGISGFGNNREERVAFFGMGRAGRELGPAETDAALGQILGVDEAVVTRVRNFLSRRDVSFGPDLDDLLRDPEPSPEEALAGKHDAAHVVETLKGALRHLAPAERAVLRGLFLENRSLRDLGKEIGVSHERARQIKVCALKKMRGLFEPVSRAA